MINVDAMLVLMQGGDPAAVDLEADASSQDPYERMFGLRNQLIEVYRESPSDTDKAFRALLAALREDFGELPEIEDRERVQEIVLGVIAYPREINDLNESEIYASHDVLVNIGVMRGLLYSYGIVVSDDALMDWMAHYSYYMVV